MKMACSLDRTGILLLRSMSIPGRVREIISLDFKAGHEIATREQLFGLPEHPATSHILGITRCFYGAQGRTTPSQSSQ
jgi:hypothetical protein